MIDAMPNAGHGLLHTLLRELELECFTGILEPPVTGEQLYGFLLRLKKYIGIDEIGGGGTVYTWFKASHKHETLITII